MRPLAVIVLGVCGSPALAHAGPAWDRTYQLEARGGEWVCPDPKGDLVVAGGRFSISWEVTFASRSFTIGRITGTVRDSGLVVDVKSRLISPLPGPVDDESDVVDRIVKDLKIRFTQRKKLLEISLSAGNCYARWTAPYREREPEAEVPDEPRRAEVESLPPPPPLKGTGAARWNGTYRQRSSYGSDWRCPASEPLKQITVRNGKVVIPWLLTTDGYGRVETAPIQIAQLDGVIAEAGTVKLRTSFVVSDLPLEISTGLPAGEATLAYVRKATPTIRFEFDDGKDKTQSRGRRMEIRFGNACSIDLLATDYRRAVVKQQPRREPELPSVDCDSPSEWHIGDDHERGDSVRIGRGSSGRVYRCKNLGCGGTPGESDNWEIVGRCR